MIFELDDAETGKFGKSAIVGKNVVHPWEMAAASWSASGVRMRCSARSCAAAELSSVELDQLKPSAPSEQCFVSFGPGTVPGPVRDHEHFEQRDSGGYELTLPAGGFLEHRVGFSSGRNRGCSSM